MTLSHLIGLTSWEQGCGQAFLGDSLRSPRPSDLLACQLASRREDHGQVSIIMSVFLDDIWLDNSLYTIVIICRKQAAFLLFLDTALKTVATSVTPLVRRIAPCRPERSIRPYVVFQQQSRRYP